MKLNPDLGTAIDPVAHYLNHGHRESWRIVTLPEIKMSSSRAFDASRETVMIVSHEASRSGAPILALNLVERLASRYNVVALLLGHGPLLDAFEQAAVATMASPRLKIMRLIQTLLLNICVAYSSLNLHWLTVWSAVWFWNPWPGTLYLPFR